MIADGPLRYPTGAGEVIRFVSQEAVPQAHYWKPDGTKLWILGNVKKIFQYTASTPGDVSTLSYDGSGSDFSVSAEVTSPGGLMVSEDGTRFFVQGDGSVHQYTTTTPFESGDLSFDSVELSVTEDPASTGTCFGDSGRSIYVAGFTGGEINQYDTARFKAVTNAHPVAATIDGREAPIFRGKRRMSSSLARSATKFLHTGSTAYTQTIRFYLYEVQNAAALFDNCGWYQNYVGYSLNISGSSLRLRICNGSGSYAADETSTVTLTAGWHTVQVTCDGSSNYSFSVDSESAITGTLSSPSSSNAQFDATLGNYTTGANPLRGIVSEMVIHDSVLDSSELAAMRAYMSTKWTATPDFSWLQVSTNLLADWDLNLGVTLNGSDVAAIADQSGHNSDHAQSTPSLQPAFLATEINGLPAIQAHDVADYMTATLTTGALTQPCSIVVFGEWADAFYGNGYIAQGAAGFAIILFESAGNPGLYSGATATTGTAVTRSARFGGVWQFNDAASAIKVEFDGAAVNEATGLNPGTTDGDTTFHLLSKPSASNGSLVKMAKCLVYAGTLSDTDRDAILAEGASLYDIEAA